MMTPQFAFPPFGNQIPTMPAMPGQPPATPVLGFAQPPMYMSTLAWQQNAGPSSGAILPARQEEMARQQQAMREKTREARVNE